MKRLIISLSINCLILGHIICSVAADQADQKISELVITVTGFDNCNGVAKIAIANSKQNYGQKVPFKGIDARIIDNKVVEIQKVPYGEYAIKIYHDENNNNELDTLMFGIPKEKYGFSNNARGKFGPPAYEEASFKISSAKTSVDIEVK
jgi:uncharacterized protein (DUF2141 family)